MAKRRKYKPPHEQYFIDCHGYEIIGLSEAKTKAKKKEAIKRHVRWHEDRVNEIERYCIQLSNDLKLI